MIGGDIDPNAVFVTSQNLQNVGPADLARWDATALPLETASVDRIVSNPPFGKQLSSIEQIGPLYEAAAAEWDRVLRPGGRAVLLAMEQEGLRRVLSARRWSKVAADARAAAGSAGRDERVEQAHPPTIAAQFAWNFRSSLWWGATIVELALEHPQRRKPLVGTTSGGRLARMTISATPSSRDQTPTTPGAGSPTRSTSAGPTSAWKLPAVAEQDRPRFARQAGR